MRSEPVVVASCSFTTMDPNMDDDDDDIGGFPTIQVAPAVQEEEQRQKKKKSGGFQSMSKFSPRMEPKRTYRATIFIS